jgi:hypothetical protein
MTETRWYRWLHPYMLRNLWTLYRMAARTHGPIGALVDVPRTLRRAARHPMEATYLTCEWCGRRGVTFYGALPHPPEPRPCPQCGGRLLEVS